MGFFFFLFVVGIIVFLIVKHRGNVAGEWERASRRLNLSYSRGGLLNPHWIYGKTDGLRYDIKTFNRSSGGSASQKWTGYRVRFRQSPDLRIRVTESARKRLTSRFQEVEIDDDGIFCARPGVESDASAIIDNAERLHSVTARLLEAAREDLASPETPAVSVPPPLQPEATAVETVVPSEPTTIELPANEGHDEPAVFEPLEAPEESPVLPGPLDPTETDDPAEELSPFVEVEDDPEPETASHSDPENAPLTLARVSHDLFDSGRNRFQITQQFDAEYEGLTMIGEGRLVKAEAFSNDRVFGRGPGTLAEVEIDHPEEPLPGHQTIRAVLQLPEETSPRQLREHIGDTVTISGTLIRCDAFEGRVFLGTGELA